MTRYLVTSALPYANGPLHLGHLAGAYLPADIYVRFLRLCDEDVLYICGTDEHGVPITITAEKMGLTPREVVDKYHGIIKDNFTEFGISFDNFSRTENPEHYAFAQEVFLKLQDRGYIEKKPMKQFFCENCKRYLPDRYVGGICPECDAVGARGDQCEKCGSWLNALELKDPECTLCNSTPQIRETIHWFLKLNEFQEWLKEWFEGHGGWKNNVLNYCRGWLKEGLRERAITRDLSWGVPVPVEGADGKVLYVWFEALLGYVSSTVEYFKDREDPSKWKKYWKNKDTRLVHFIGKDNIVFHAVIEPAILHGLGDFAVPWNVPANEYLNIAGEKFSTSRGRAIWMKDYLEHFPPDPMRFALAINAPESRDTDFSWEEFRVRNNELADVFGNFINRTLKFAQSFFDGKVPENGRIDEPEKELMKLAIRTRDEMAELMRSFKLKKACLCAMDLARAGNRYFDGAQPWKTVKTDPQACADTIYTCIQIADTLRILFSPFIPFTCKKTAKMLNRTTGKWTEAGCENMKQGHQLGKPEILLEKLKKGFEKIFEEKKGEVEEKVNKEKGNITYSDFMKTDLRVAVIEDVSDIEGADKLYKLIVSLGGEKRELVAGIKPYYCREELVGRKVVVVSNLEQAKIRGVISNGMILASDGPAGVKLVEPSPDATPGDRVR